MFILMFVMEYKFYGSLFFFFLIECNSLGLRN